MRVRETGCTMPEYAYMQHKKPPILVGGFCGKAE
jgi:hypothetical protein